MPERVTIAIPNVHLESGPRDAQFIVHDVDYSAGAVYQPARFLPEQNAFEPLDPDDVRTHQINAKGAFTLYRLPHGGAAMRLNACSRFRSNEMSVAPYPITQLKALGKWTNVV